MNIFTLFVVIAVIATVLSLLGGVASMVAGHDVGHRTSVQWMNLRVALQGVAFLMIMLVAFSSQ
ncbi:MAG: HIG1 domain-containing protein [Pseudomonadota bacterium]